MKNFFLQKKATYEIKEELRKVYEYIATSLSSLKFWITGLKHNRTIIFDEER